MRSGRPIRFSLLVCLLFAMPLAAQFTGTWSGHYDEWDTDENCFFARGEMTLALAQTGNSVAGDVTTVFTTMDCDPLTTPITAIWRYTGTVAGNTLNGTLFSVNDENGNPESNQVSFTLSGNTLTLVVPPPSMAVLTQTSSTPPDTTATGTYDGTYSASVRPSRCSFQNPITYSGALSGSVWQTGVHLAAAVTAKTAKLIDQQCAQINANLSVFFENVTIAGQPPSQQVAGTIWWNDEFSAPFTGTLNGTTLSGSGTSSDNRNSFSFSITKAAAPVAPSITSFTATPSTIVAGASSTLSWVVNDTTSVSIDNGVGARPVVGTATVSPAATTTYTLTATGAVGPADTKTATVTVTPQCPSPTLVITSFPRGMLQPVGGALPTDSYTLTNAGTTTATVNLSQTGSFFTQSPASFTLQADSSQVVIIAATAQPVGFYPGTSTISACGGPTGLSVKVLLRVAAPPATAITVTSSSDRVDLAAGFGPGPSGIVSFTNPGASPLDGVVVTDVPWLIPGNPTLSLAAGATSAVEFSVDRAQRPDAGALAGGATGTISFRYVNAGTGSTGLPGDVAAQTTAPASSVSVSTVVVVDVVKGATSNQTAPPLGSQLALFVTGATSRSAFGDLVLSNRNPTAAITDLQMYFGANPGPPAQGSSIGQFPANAAFSFPGVLKNIFNDDSRSGTIQLRSAQVGNVSVAQTQVNSAVGKTYGTALPVFRSDQGFLPGEALFLPGVQKGGTLTTTLYLQEVSGARTSVIVDQINEQGTVNGAFFPPIELAGFGSEELPDYVLPGTTTLRVRNVVAPLAGTINAYALMKDSATGDSFVIAQSTPATGADPLFVPAFAGEGGRFMALHLANASATAAINVSATAVIAPAPGRRRATSFSAAGSTGASQSIVALAAIPALGYQQMTVPEIGFVKLAGSTSLRVTGRYTVPRTGGVIGTGVPVVPGSAALALNGKMRFAGIEDSSPATVASARPLTYRTNLMLVETTGTGSATVRLTLRFVFAAAKVSTGSVVSRDFPVPRGGFTMVPDLGRSIIGTQRALFGNLHNAILDVEVVGGTGAVIPFLQAIDNGTGDVIIRHQ